MKHCQHCGAEVFGGDIVCTNCRNERRKLETARARKAHRPVCAFCRSNKATRSRSLKMYLCERCRTSLLEKQCRCTPTEICPAHKKLNLCDDCGFRRATVYHADKRRCGVCECKANPAHFDAMVKRLEKNYAKKRIQGNSRKAHA